MNNPSDVQSQNIEAYAKILAEHYLTTLVTTCGMATFIKDKGNRFVMSKLYDVARLNGIDADMSEKEPKIFAGYLSIVFELMDKSGATAKLFNEAIEHVAMQDAETYFERGK